jgi:beta-glucosidase
MHLERNHQNNPNAEHDQACEALVNMEAVNASVAKADVVVLILGLNVGSTNEEGRDRTDYALPGKQADLVQVMAALGKPVVAVVISGGAVGIDYIGTREDWSLLIPGQSGIYGPRALARVLFGDVAPSGE